MPNAVIVAEVSTNFSAAVVTGEGGILMPQKMSFL
jgi:hypothetical protein